MGVRAYLSSWFGKSHRHGGARRGPSSRPRLTVRALEDRCLLSTGVYPYTPGGYASWAPGQSFTGVSFNPGIVGIDLHVKWNEVQTGPTDYDWSKLDATIQQAQALGLKVCLMLVDGPVNVPNFVLNNPSVAKVQFMDTVLYHDTYGQMLTGPVFWDPTYLADRVAFIQAVGARYANNPDVIAVTCGAANWYTDDWQVPNYVGPLRVGSTTYLLDQVGQWQAAGYTDAKMQSAIQQILNATAAAFPHQSLKMEVGVTAAALDGTTTALAADAVNYGYANDPGRFYAQLNFLTPQSPAATDPTLGTYPNTRDYIFYLLSQHPGQVGLQMLASAANGPLDGYRENRGVVAPATAVLQNAVNVAMTYQPVFVEYWTNDATTPLPDLTIPHSSDPYQQVINVPNPTNAPLTYSAVVVTAQAAVDAKLGLGYTGNYWQGSFGIGGMWLRSTNGANVAHGGWYFLLPDGSLHEWDGGSTGATATTSPTVATFSPAVYANPLLLAAAAGADTAFTEERALDLVFTGNFFQGYAGINGKWFKSANGSNAAHGGWYFLLPDGTLHAWDGGSTGATAATSPTVATLNGTYWQVPSLLYNATPSPAPPAGITAAFVGTSNVLQLGGYQTFAGAFGVEVGVNNGSTTTAEDFLVTVTDPAPTLAAVPDQTASHSDGVTVTLAGGDADPNATLSYGAQVFTDTPATEAYALQKQLGLTFTGNYYQGYAGISGKWLKSADGGNAAHGGWYFLLPDGSLHAWDGGTTGATATTSPTVATPGASYYADPNTLVNAAPTPAPAGITVTVVGSAVTFGNFGNFTGTLFVVASVTDGIQTASTIFHVSVV